MICIIILMAALVTASLSDFKRHEISPSLIISCIIFRYVWLCFNEGNIKYYLIFGITAFVVFYLVAMFSSLGGGDCLVITMIASYLGLNVLYVLFLAFAGTIPYNIYMEIKNERHEYAFIPYLCIATIITIIWRI